MLRSRRRKRRSEDGTLHSDVDIRDPDDEHETFDVNPRVILVFVVVMCVMLVTLYFLYDYLGRYILVNKYPQIVKVSKTF